MFTQPNLAAKLKPGEDYDTKLQKLDLAQGFFLSPKLDGVRITVHPEKGALTRTLKEIPCRKLHQWFFDNREALAWFDGELTYGWHDDPAYSFQKTMSVFSTEDDGSNDWKYMIFNVFDQYHPTQTFISRISGYRDRIVDLLDGGLSSHAGLRIDDVPQEHVTSVHGIYQMEEFYLSKGYEGAMIRHQNSLYKCGRSTWKEQGLIAIKRFEDAEAEIIGFEELMHNENEATVDARGLQVRSSHQTNKVAGGTLGKLIVRGIKDTPFDSITFAVGSGFSKDQRQTIWNEGIEQYQGRLITFKYQPVGVKEKPRTPIFKGFRGDM